MFVDNSCRIVLRTSGVSLHPRGNSYAAGRIERAAIRYLDVLPAVAVEVQSLTAFAVASPRRTGNGPVITVT